MTPPPTDVTTELLVFTGDVGAPDFVDWIIHRARRLGLKGWVNTGTERRVEVLVAGPIDLVDAMELCCSLGPMSVSVDAVERKPHAISPLPNGFGRRVPSDIS